MATDLDERATAQVTGGEARRKRLAVKIAIQLALSAVFLLWVWINDDLNQIGALLKSSRGIFVLTLIVLGIAAVPRLLRPVIRNEWARFLVITVPIVAVIAWMTIPFFVDRTANDAFPVVRAGPGPATGATASTDAGRAAPAETTVAPVPAVVPSGPTRVSTGQLEGIDHRASGTVSIYKLEDGSHVVRFEDFDVQNGPDYKVYLVPSAEQTGPDGGFDLGPMRANRGNLNVEVPAGTDVSAYGAVLIWCRAFSVPIAHAPQSV